MKITSVLLFLLCIIFFQIPLSSEIYSRLEGIVKDKDTGTSLENVEVLLYEFDHLSKRKRIYRNNTTDIKGHFIIDNIRVRDKARFSYFLSFRKSGYVPIVPEYLLIYAKDIDLFEEILDLKQGEVRFLEIGLEKGGRTKFQLLEKKENGIFPILGEGVELLRVRKNGEIYSKNLLLVSNEATNQEGEVAFDSLSPDGDYELLVLRGGFPIYIKKFTIKKNEEVFLKHIFDYTAKINITGKISKQGQPLFNAGIYLQTDQNVFVSKIEEFEDGATYSFRCILPGDYILTSIYIDENDQAIEKIFKISVVPNTQTIQNVNFD